MILRVLLTIIGFALANFNISRFNMTQNGFPKVIWSYWSQDINQAPFFVQLCMMNIDNEAIKNEWSHVLLSNENLHEYLDP